MAFYNNADWFQSFVVKEDGVAVDISGKQLYMAWRTQAIHPVEVLHATTEDGTLTITDGPNGMFDLSLPFGRTAQVPAGTYYWDLIEVVSATSRPRITGGTWTVSDGVARGDVGFS